MRLKELKNKTNEELTQLHAEACEQLQDLQFKVANQQLKNVREIRLKKKTIARVLTLLSTEK
jgi:ribosomal protein L29